MVRKKLFVEEQEEGEKDLKTSEGTQGEGAMAVSTGRDQHVQDQHSKDEHDRMTLRNIRNNRNSKNSSVTSSISTNASATSTSTTTSKPHGLFQRSSSERSSSVNKGGPPMPLRRAFLHRSSTSAPTIPMGWWHATPDCDLWNERYQMAAYLCSVGRFGKLYTCFQESTGDELTVKVVRKSRWNSSTTATTAVTSTTRTTSKASSNISLDQPRKPHRASHYLNQVHPHRHHLQEFSLLKSFSHPNILRLRDDIIMEDSRFYYIVTEFYNPNTQSLQAFLQTQLATGATTTEAQVASMLYQMMSCINYIHQRHVVHCNLKLDTFIVTKVAQQQPPSDQPQQYKVQLTDFANAVVLADLTDDHTSAVLSRLRLMEPRGAIRYMAPEVVAIDKSYGPKCDVWSLGIIAHVLLTNQFPLDGSTFAEVKERVLSIQSQDHWLLQAFCTWPAWQACSNEGKHFVDRLLAPLELERPTPEQALQHPWLQPYWAFSSERTASSTASTESTDSNTLDRTNIRSEHDMIEEDDSDVMMGGPPLLRLQTTSDSIDSLRQQLTSGSSGLTSGSSGFFSASGTSQPPLHVIQEMTHQSDNNNKQKERLQQRAAIDAFVQAHTQIRNEWNRTQAVLLETHNLSLLEDTSLSRDDVRAAYRVLFHHSIDLSDDDLDRVFGEFDAAATGSLQGLDFFVAVLNEKELLFTHALQEAFEVFDTNHSGLVTCSDLMDGLQAYIAAANTTTRTQVVQDLLAQVESDAQEYEKNVVAVEELVAMILETAIPKSGRPSTVTNNAATSPLSLQSSSENNINFESTPPQQVIQPSPSGESSLSTDSRLSRRRSSLMDRLSLKFSAKHFIAQRPGRLSHHYELLEFVNEGGCGAVWFCRHKETGAERAVKLVRKAQKDVEYNRRILDEFTILRELDHPNILKQFELFEDPNFFYIVMDAAHGGDLCDELDEFGAFVEHAAALLMKQLLSCINYLHSLDIVHCDLKPENLLLEANKELSQIKVIDFGFAANIKKAPNQRLTRRWGTIHYSAPEVFAGNYGKKADMWSAGVISFLLLSDEFPFHGEGKQEIMAMVLSGKFSLDGPHWAHVSEMAKDFVAKLLTVDEDKRLSAEEALQHPWIRSATQQTVAAMKPGDHDAMTKALSNLVKFSANSKLKQASLSLISSQLLEKKEKEAIDAVFRRLDVTCNGRLSRTEIRLALKNFLGTDLSDQAVDDVFERVDVASTGYIEYSEFVVAAMNEDDFLKSGKYKRAFDVWDVNKTGFITMDNLKVALSNFLTGDEATDAAIVSKIINEVDADHDGLISFDEFVADMTSKNADTSKSRQQASKATRKTGFLNFATSVLFIGMLLLTMVDSFSLGPSGNTARRYRKWQTREIKRIWSPTPKSLERYSNMATSVQLENGSESSSRSADQSGICHSQQTLNPDQIFFPRMASLFEASERDRESPLLTGVPLFEALNRLEKALQVLANANRGELQSILGDLAAFGTEESVGTQTLRIEQTVSHSVDPLGWLYAQNKRQLYLEPGQKDPLFYIQSTVEAAVFGTAWTWVEPTKGRPEFWATVNSLPKDSYLYGGERFDVESLDEDRVDWKDFGATWWVLPAVELREEPMEQVIRTTDAPANKRKQTTLAVHLAVDGGASSDPATAWQDAARRSLQILKRLNDAVMDNQVPATTLPPVIMRESCYNGTDGQELYEQGVTAALEEFGKSESGLKKVVLARRMDLLFQSQLSALDILRKWKYNDIHEGGNLFYIRPLGSEEFFGCTPERLFTIQKNSNVVLTEALAGTRPRGTTQAADDELLRDLFGSTKDRSENSITADFIRSVFAELAKFGWVRETDVMLPQRSSLDNGDSSVDRANPVNQTTAGMTAASGTGYFVRRLRHLQHICQRFSARLAETSDFDNTGASVLVNVVQHLLANLHPTPAVNGFPSAPAMAFIREKETVGFDRGFYSGPVGYMGRNAADILVAIRSGLASPTKSISSPDGMYAGNGDLTGYGPTTKISAYAGAGLVPGSTVQGEWAETSYKLGVVSSLFPQSPITLQSAPTPNVAWASAFVEELIRNGITQFYVCPGSRSTPLVVAISRAARSNVGVVNAVSVHDERGAGFRAIGYARGANRPAAIITSSGTAIANLYPAVVEAGMDGVPMVILTADRPYENRDTGANQAIDQVKAYSASYVRWFRDILPPHDDVPVSVALADAGHAVEISKSQRGPVHVNIQFRENLAPDVGPLRNDNRVDSVTKFNGVRFTDVPGFARWSTSGDRWLTSYAMSSGNYGGMGTSHAAVVDLARLIMESERGIIVIGNIRRPTDEDSMDSVEAMYDNISTFAETIGFPIVAGAQNAHLRFSSSAVIPFAEHILKNPKVAQNIKPDLIIQIGAPLVSAEVPSMISNALRTGGSSACHVLIHPHHGTERADPSFTVSRKISAEISPFLKVLSNHLDKSELSKRGCGSKLAPLVLLGRKLQREMPKIINEASRSVSKDDLDSSLTEPQVVLALSMMMSNSIIDQSLFLSNSMPIRDAEFFLYPTGTTDNASDRGVLSVGSNRGASGIDGIIASATGFAESTGVATTLLIGDLSALHDLNSLHALSSGTTSAKKPLTILLVNNDGGGIFSFLPIAKHGADVSFNDFFGTPTSSFSFEDGADAFGLPSQQASRLDSFCRAYAEAIRSDQSSLIEARVVGREKNVAVHRRITQKVNAFVASFLVEDGTEESGEPMPVKYYSRPEEHTNGASPSDEEVNGEDRKTLVLIHGWMGDKTEWDDVGEALRDKLDGWDILAVDLPGHGASARLYSSDTQAVRSALNIDFNEVDERLSVDEMAKSVIMSLSKDFGVTRIDALAGYSLGGRVALAMKRLCSLAAGATPSLVKENTKLVLLSAFPGQLPQPDGELASITPKEDMLRLSNDERLAGQLAATWNRGCLGASSGSNLLWSDFLKKWYSMPMWGDLYTSGKSFELMAAKRLRTLSYRGVDLAEVLRKSSPPRHSKEDWRGVQPESTLYVAGGRDTKYTELGQRWSHLGISFVEVPDAGHALLVEASETVATSLRNFILSEDILKNEPPRKSRLPPLFGRRGRKDGAESRQLQNQVVESTFQAPMANLTEAVSSLEYDPFVINTVDENRKQRGVLGIGWGDKAKRSSQMTNRSGFILQIVGSDGSKVGVGEVSPLPGLHKETLAEAETQLGKLKHYLENEDGTKTQFEVASVLAMDGELKPFIDELARDAGVTQLTSSVRAGLEMALLSLASQVVQNPVHQALVSFAPEHSRASTLNAMLPVNGLITRGSAYTSALQEKARRMFPSLKVKVGHQGAVDDAASLAQTLKQSQEYRGPTSGTIRADANRAWTEETAMEFVTALQSTDARALGRLEFVEEPLQRQDTHGWSLENQVSALEQWYMQTGIPWALDESFDDLAQQHSYRISSMKEEIVKSFGKGNRGCAAFVLKPSLLGLELTLQIARLARNELGIGVTISSSFDSGIGLAYAAILGAVSDATGDAKRFSHGVGTFAMLDGDTLRPSFASYVNENGFLNVLSLSRALNGLGLDELRDSFVFFELPAEDSPTLFSSPSIPEPNQVTTPQGADDYEASTATSSSGREVKLVASLPLPFSAEIGCARFTDFPQQSRWSPWVQSVRYLDDGRETEWTLNVRGVQFTWRAISKPLQPPLKGIEWESVSGLKNRGLVEFSETGDTAIMRVRMSIMLPRILATIFQSTSVFVEDFLEDKLLKWSLEMFRDVVKGDIALERGDVELGDALFGSVEGKATAIQAALSLSLPNLDENEECSTDETNRNKA
ncbi:MAP kinase-activated protein kinase 2 (Fragment) [Seminavis robusta]|uniref:non-specific serine/threonine protein kinase n=1 Tax=Seminavis robusta TaxID=568900 RepID=A0A9N8E498_9STRA